MTESATSARIARASPSVTARAGGFFWLMTIVTGALAMYAGGARWGMALGLVATACYVAATLYVNELLKPVNRRLSLLAVLFSLVGCAAGALSGFLTLPRNLPFVFFGLHCFLVGYLILKSTFLPRFAGALMTIGGLSWLTFGLVGVLSLPLPRSMAPYLMAPGILGEVVLTLCLLVMGVNDERWKEEARRAAG